ncbi:hypothetical protein AXG93_1217s1350 [Marchantia polymorpha subsp. ruderalis]|uniref:Uncharacterized protein n=1 Tax=Marchantia polymorpha subsp. ruderalis TaxID=1480154 RepID=A0A176VU27_MARPO|nr:hypothetical protein AXG93_1217s1350 [Marchantia polymorpha subsp. ruderalis]
MQVRLFSTANCLVATPSGKIGGISALRIPERSVLLPSTNLNDSSRRVERLSQNGHGDSPGIRDRHFDTPVMSDILFLVGTASRNRSDYVVETSARLPPRGLQARAVSMRQADAQFPGGWEYCGHDRSAPGSPLNVNDILTIVLSHLVHVNVPTNRPGGVSVCSF